MGLIVINDKYAIKSDKDQWMICEYVRVKHKPESKNINCDKIVDGYCYYWSPFQYYTKLDAAVRQLGNRMVRESDFHSAGTLSAAFGKVVGELQAALPDLKVEAGVKVTFE